jgi:hypothetical protein
MRDQLDATISDFIGNQLFLNMFRASLRPSSVGLTAFHCHRQANSSSQCTQLAIRLSNITCITTGQKNIGSKNAVRPPDDEHKDTRNMLRNNWLPIKSLIFASSWSRLYLIIKDARSFQHNISWNKFRCLTPYLRNTSSSINKAVTWSEIYSIFLCVRHSSCLPLYSPICLRTNSVSEIVLCSFECYDD